MCPRMLATLLALLAGTSVALGQPSSLSPAPPQPPPLTSPPALETLPSPSALAGVPRDIMTPAVVSGTVFPDVGPPAGWMWQVNADVVLWFSPTHANPTFVDAPNLAGTVVPGGSNTLGNENIPGHMIPGARLSLGYWWMEDNPWTPGGKLPMAGFEARFMVVGERSFTETNNNSPTLVRPFYDINKSIADVLVVSSPGTATGSLSTRSAQSIWGAEGNYWRNLYYEWPGTTCSFDGMIGVRYLNLDDSFQVSTNSQFAAVPALPAYAPLAGSRLADLDSFTAHNQFFGAQAGVRANLIFDRFIVSGQFQLAAGGTNEQIDIQGSQIRTLPTGQTITLPGAFYALPSNIGVHSHNEFTLVPEFGATLTVPVNEYLSFGFTFTTLYWSRIIRAADQIDTAINIAQVPNFPGAATAAAVSGAHPGVQFNQSDLWLLGAMLTAQFRW